MPTKAEILAKYQQVHAELTKQFYVNKTMDKATFDTQHLKCWSDLQQELLTYGYLTQYWRYTFSATITTPSGDVVVSVAIYSPTKLTTTEIQNNIDKLKTANWQITEEFIEYRET